MSYWQDREAAAQNALTTKSIEETEAQLKKYYQKARSEVINNFQAVILKLQNAAANGEPITPADLYKLDKYYLAQNQLEAVLFELGDKQVKLYAAQFRSQYKAIYTSLAAKGDQAFSLLDEQKAEQLINKIWCADQKSWSERVWDNTSRLRQELNNELVSCVVNGEKSSFLKNQLIQRFGVSYHRADTLVRTEMAHIQSEAAKERYKGRGVQKVQLWGDEDERRCDMCGEYHKKIYLIDEAPTLPLHPNCRCCYIPIIN